MIQIKVTSSQVLINFNLAMASKCHSTSARIALLFFLLLASGEMRECKPKIAPPEPQNLRELVQNGVNGVWDSDAVNDGTAQRQSPAPTPIDDSIGDPSHSAHGRYLLWSSPEVNSAVPDAGQ